jgi:hypothetical protein
MRVAWTARALRDFVSLGAYIGQTPRSASSSAFSPLWLGLRSFPKSGAPDGIAVPVGSVRERDFDDVPHLKDRHRRADRPLTTIHGK